MNDYDIAQRYVSKANHARQNGIEFSLSFTSFKNMMKSKRCKYTGIELTDSGKQLITDRTIDRIDSNKGYVKGNVVCICRAANQFKSLFENPQYPITLKLARKIIGIVEKSSGK